MTFAVHDLVRVDPTWTAQLRDAPPWVAASLRRAPWLVVRREAARARIAAGIRGVERTQRFATHVRAGDVVARVRPEMLCAAATRRDGRLGDAARSVAAFATDRGFAWGPVGSFGFELATGRTTTTAHSDLDIVVRAAGVSRETLLGLDGVRSKLAEHDVVLDVELAFDVGGIALGEYVRRPAYLLAKTARGPVCVPCP